MVWPFVTIFIRQRLNLPLGQTALLLTVNAAFGVAATGIAGPVVDRFGRKGAMVMSLLGGVLVMVGMSQANSYGVWAVLMGLNGMFQPLYKVGGDSMVADLVPPERRPDAYALLRMSSNLGIAIGPTLGGLVTTISYTLVFYIAAAVQGCFAMLVLLFTKETFARHKAERRAELGYGPVFRDRRYMAFAASYVVANMAYALIFTLFPVYAKENFGIVEAQYGLIMATNALGVVFFQYAVARSVARMNPLRVMAVGSLLYALSIGAIGFARNFAGFLACMVLLTVGELICSPTSTTYAANAAPPEMRGRYMGVYSLTWSIGFGVGPVAGGFLNDRISPHAIWYFGLMMGLLAMVWYLVQDRQASRLVRQP